MEMVYCTLTWETNWDMKSNLISKGKYNLLRTCHQLEHIPCNSDTRFEMLVKTLKEKFNQTLKNYVIFNASSCETYITFFFLCSVKHNNELFIAECPSCFFSHIDFFYCTFISLFIYIYVCPWELIVTNRFLLYRGWKFKHFAKCFGEKL